jgi:hypothetical protein
MYELIVAEQVKQLLEGLIASDRGAARELALLLKGLAANPTPPGSRELEPTMIEKMRGEREWERPPFRIFYTLRHRTGALEVGAVVLTAPVRVAMHRN